MNPSEFLAARGAPRRFVQWTCTLGSLADVWTVCPEVDWLVWTVGCLHDLGRGDFAGPLRAFAVACARRVEALMLDPRSRRALEVAARGADAAALAAAWTDAREAAAEGARSPDWCASVSLAASAAAHVVRPRPIDAALDAPWCARRAFAWHPTDEGTEATEAAWQLALARARFDAAARPLLVDLAPSRAS